jgi:hypothetical protein
VRVDPPVSEQVPGRWQGRNHDQHHHKGRRCGGAKAKAAAEMLPVEAEVAGVAPAHLHRDQHREHCQHQRDQT